MNIGNTNIDMQRFNRHDSDRYPFIKKYCMAVIILFGLTLISSLALAQAGNPPAPQKTTPATSEPVSSSLPALTTGELMYHILVAETATRRRQFDLALSHYQAAANSSDDPRIAERATNIALFINDDAATLALAQRWYALDSDNPRVHRALALALLREGKVDEALDHLEAVRTTATADPHEGFATVSSLLGQITDREVIFETMEKLLALHPQSAYALYYHALAALGVEKMDQTMTSLNQALDIMPDSREALLLRARVKIEQGDPEQALAELASAVDKHPDDRELRLGYARMLVTADKLAESQAQFEILAQQDPDDAESLYALGILAAEAGQLDAAENYLLKVLELNQRPSDVYFELGKIEEQRLHYDKAQQWYERVGEGERYLSAQVKAATMLAQQGDTAAMHTRMAELRLQNPEDTTSLYIAEAEILREKKLYQDAFDKLSEALADDVDNNDLLYARALAAEKIDRLDVLETDLTKIIAEDPDNGHALNALGYTLADRTDRYTEALAYLEKAIALLPDDAAVLDSMGWVKYRLQQYDEALKYLRRAYEVNDDAEIVSHLIEVLWESGQQDEARKLLQKALKKDPENDYLMKLKERIKLG
jgi:tetratricopeptide (TPR) repeat protein